MKVDKMRTLLMLFCLLCWYTRGQEKKVVLATAESESISSVSLLAMNRRFHEMVDNGRLAGIQTAIARNGKLIHFDSYGFSNIEKKTKLDQKSIFRIFSMTKPIVSIVLMTLYEEGKFRLDDPLHKYLPEFEEMFVFQDSVLVPAKNPIRIIDLLRHTSGFNYGRSQHEKLNEHYAAAGLEQSSNNKVFVNKLSKLPLLFEPGTDWAYGYSTNICGHLIEVLSGKSLDTFLKEKIFEPLQMNDTLFLLPKEKIHRFTVGYGWEEEGGLTVIENEGNNRYVKKVTLYNGGGGLVSTTIDYCRN